MPCRRRWAHRAGCSADLGASATNLKIESRVDPAVVSALVAAGHEVETVGAYEEMMGHAGAIVLSPSGLFEGAADPRSDGAAMGF
jgi:gamma-glutamyltranspeptidase/glutathione hydrolase